MEEDRGGRGGGAVWGGAGGVGGGEKEGGQRTREGQGCGGGMWGRVVGGGRDGVATTLLCWCRPGGRRRPGGGGGATFGLHSACSVVDVGEAAAAPVGSGRCLLRTPPPPPPPPPPLPPTPPPTPPPATFVVTLATFTPTCPAPLCDRHAPTVTTATSATTASAQLPLRLLLPSHRLLLTRALVPPSFGATHHLVLYPCSLFLLFRLFSLPLSRAPFFTLPPLIRSAATFFSSVPPFLISRAGMDGVKTLANAVIAQTPMSGFVGDARRVHVVCYAYEARAGRLYPPEEVVARARSRIGHKRYDLLYDNCESCTLVVPEGAFSLAAPFPRLHHCGGEGHPTSIPSPLPAALTRLSVWVVRLTTCYS